MKHMKHYPTHKKEKCMTNLEQKDHKVDSEALVVQTDLVDLEMEDIIHIVLQMDLTDFQTLEI